MPSPRRAALYVRVSTQDQSCELQRRELRDFAQSRGWQVVEIFEDKATGTNGNRPMLKALMAGARERRFDVVCVWKLDRFARSLKDLVTMLQELTDLGVEFVAMKDSVDLTTSAGRLMTHMIAAFAEFEASLIRERTRAGIAQARARGKRLGRPKSRDDRAIHDLRLRGFSMRQIAKHLKTSVGAVQRALSSPGVSKKPARGTDGKAA